MITEGSSVVTTVDWSNNEPEKGRFRLFPVSGTLGLAGTTKESLDLHVDTLRFAIVFIY